MLARRSVAEGRNGAFGGVQPAAKRCAAKLQTEAQREWRFDYPFVSSASAVTRRAGEAGQRHCRGASVGHGGEATWRVIECLFEQKQWLIATLLPRVTNARSRQCAALPPPARRVTALALDTNDNQNAIRVALPSEAWLRNVSLRAALRQTLRSVPPLHSGAPTFRPKRNFVNQHFGARGIARPLIG